MSNKRDVFVSSFVKNQNGLAFETEHETWTYKQILVASIKLAESWSNSGLKQGDKIVLMLPNCVEFACSYIACMLFGYVAVPINPELGTVEKELVLGIIEPAKMIDKPPDLERLDAKGDLTIELPTIEDSAPIAIFFTSGTTGAPKGVIHSTSSLVTNALAFNRQQNMGSSQRFMHFLPMNYMAGFLNSLLCPLLAGGTIILAPRFSPQSAMNFMNLVEAKSINTMWITPSICAMLLKLTRDRDLALKQASGLSNVFCGTAPLHNEIRSGFFKTFGCWLQESYGTSELLLIACQSKDAASTEANVGELLDTVRVSFASSENESELTIHCDHAYLGYLTHRGFLAPERTDSGQFTTGDLAVFERGRLTITGRLKDLIIRGGINISPIAIENSVDSIEGIFDLCVIGIPDAFWGEKIVLILEVGGTKLDEAELQTIQKTANGKLGKAQKIDQVVCIARFPRTNTGKVLKHELAKAL